MAKLSIYGTPIPNPILECGRAGFGYRVILLARTSAHPDCAHYLPVALQGNAARENHDLAVV